MQIFIIPLSFTCCVGYVSHKLEIGKKIVMIIETGINTRIV